MFGPIRNYLRLLAEGHNKGGLSKILIPVLEVASLVYGTVVSIIRFLYEKKILRPKRLPFPVVSVGNLTWGGTGKTPLVEYLARKVCEYHRTVMILTRGYSKDEVNQFHHHLPKVVIGVGRNRVRTAQALIAKNRIDLAILDDGLQHWPVERDAEIVTVNALNPFGNGKLIPRGILREPVTILRKATIVVISHVNLVKPEEREKLRNRIRTIAPRIQIVESFMEPLFFYRAQNRSRLSLDRLQKERVTTFSGVGAPRSFQLLLMNLQIKPIRNFEFPDHHVFTERELMEIKAVAESASTDEIVTTEKDFYRTPEAITRILNPLILAVRLRFVTNEDILTELLSRFTGATRS
ncbi:MAG: tetraacyldisaccharide 4'-kinase [Candidatus Omnitrophica bacterium]|nr:tetraacyldisaccharide 4'-kinase [Candidatus Omnitrophota bacterium]